MRRKYRCVGGGEKTKGGEKKKVGFLLRRGWEANATGDVLILKREKKQDDACVSVTGGEREEEDKRVLQNERIVKRPKKRKIRK